MWFYTHEETHTQKTIIMLTHNVFIFENYNQIMASSTFRCIIILLIEKESLSFIYLFSGAESKVVDLASCSSPSVWYTLSPSWQTAIVPQQEFLGLAKELRTPRMSRIFRKKDLGRASILNLDSIMNQMWSCKSDWFIKFRMFFLLIRANNQIFAY